MVDLLALHPITKIDQIIETIPRPASGLPINFLPGWSRVPLCCKLPMMDTPTNEIVFTKGKMGKALWKPGDYVLYDPNCYVVKLDYDPLHDPHLKYFYRRPVNFQKIKQIGRVTDNKDVVCNLKEFNDYRQYLCRLHNDRINKEIERRELQQRDRFLLKIAEYEATKQAEKFRNSVSHTRSEIVLIKAKKESAYRKKGIEALFKFNRAIERIEAIKRYEVETSREKSKLQYLTVKARIEKTKEIEKLRIIGLKRKFMTRDVQRNNFIKMRFAENRKVALVKKIIRWKKRVEYRAWKYEVNKQVRNEASFERAANVEKHRKDMQEKWAKIKIRITSKRIKHRWRNLMKKLTYMLHTKIKQTNKKRATENKFAPAQYSQEELHDVLSTAMSLHDIQPNDKMSSEMVLNSAKYILENVIKSVTRNLGDDLVAVDYLKQRLKELFHRIKKHVLLKVDRVIHAHDEPIRQQNPAIGPTKSSKLSKSIILPLWSNHSADTMAKIVSFGSTELIGETTQKPDPFVELKSVKNRTPTPASSFTSLNAVAKDSDPDVSVSTRDRVNYELLDLTVKERIFVEHLYIKFKKTLLVGVERAVFEAIDFKKGELRLYAKKEILDLDREYLTNIMAESILTYNLNNYSYIGNTRLCISVVTADCLCGLEKTKIRMKYDPAYRVEPHCRGNISKM